MLSEPIIARVMSQIISAVMYCHNNRYIVKGLELENVLIEKYVSRDPSNILIKLIDFGCA
jgi:serine/threonine protein kinase